MAFKKRTPTPTPTNLPSIDKIRTYITKKGWVCDYDWQGKIEYYQNPQYPFKEVKLTVDESIKDFDKRLINFFYELAELENRSQVALIEDVLGKETPKRSGTIVPSVGDEVSTGIDPVKPVIHDANGKFIKGNKVAAIPGQLHMASIKKHRHMIADRADELIKRAMDLALTDDLSKTNVNCLMDLLKLYLPTPKPVTFVDATINADNLQTLSGVKNESINMIKQLEGGQTPAESIVAALDILHAHIKFIEAADIEPRMREIEHQMKKANAGS